MGTLTAILTILILVYLGLALFALVAAPRMIFPVPYPTYKVGPDYFMLETEGGHPCVARYWECPGATLTLLYHHGNGEDLGGIAPLMEALSKSGWSVLAYDYPGYGCSPGRPSESGVHRAADAAYQWLVNVRQVPPGRIVHYGRSLGSGPAVALAARFKAAGLILDGAFTSTFRVITHWKLLPWDCFDNLRLIGQLRLPILLIHGTDDRTCAIWHARHLAQSLPHADTLFVPGAHHNNLIEVAGEAYWDALSDFAKKLSP